MKVAEREQEEQTGSKPSKKKTKAMEQAEEEQPVKKTAKKGAVVRTSKASRSKTSDEHEASDQDDMEPSRPIEGKRGKKAKSSAQEEAAVHEIEEGPEEDMEEGYVAKGKNLQEDAEEEEEEPEAEYSDVDDETLLRLPASERTEPPSHFRYNNIYSSAHRAALARNLPLAAAQQRARNCTILCQAQLGAKTACGQIQGPAPACSC